MNAEDRLRAAIAARTSRVEPSPDALHHIEEQLMDAQRDTNRTRVLIGLGSAAAAAALVFGVLAVTGDDDENVNANDDTTTTTEPATTETTEDTTTTTTGITPAIDPALAVWPRTTTSQRFEDPVSAAHSFVVDFVGFADPVMGEFQQGDARSGEVPVQPRADGPVTTVLVRQLEDDSWFVIGSTTDDITLDQPEVGDDIDCPVRLTGEALAFEGHVDVAIRDDVSDEPIGTGFVTGGGGPSAPFDGEVECDLDLLDDGIHYGSIVLTTEGGEDSQVWQAVVVRVQLK
jgi:hypothetical protein